MRISAILLVLVTSSVAMADRATMIAADVHVEETATNEVIAAVRTYDVEVLRLREQLARNLRPVLTTDQLQRVMFLLSTTEPDATELPPCDPFEAMHRCPN